VFCTKGLQKKETNVASCTVLLDELKDRVSKFDLDDVLKFGFELAEKYDVQHFDCRVSGRQRRIPEALRSSIIMTSIGQNNVSSEEELRTLLKRIISHISGKLDSRFSDDQYGVMKSVNGCFPNSDRFMDKDIIRSVTSLYGFTIPDAERTYSVNLSVDESLLKYLHLLICSH